LRCSVVSCWAGRVSPFLHFLLQYLRQQIVRSVVIVGWFVRVFMDMCWSRISRKRLEIETWFQWTTVDMVYGESNGHVLDDVT